MFCKCVGCWHCVDTLLLSWHRVAPKIREAERRKEERNGEKGVRKMKSTRRGKKKETEKGEETLKGKKGRHNART